MKIHDLGICGYEDVLRVQTGILRARIEGKIPDTLIIGEHEPVVTLGRTETGESIVDEGYFKKMGISVIRSARGGKITYHAPGQLVMYPVVDLKDKKKDIAAYIDLLEKTVMGSLRYLGVPAERSADARGVWVSGEKIAFIGIALKQWVTYHGIAVNINNDIKPFSGMHPCGEKHIRVTSASRWLGHSLELAAVKEVFAERFKEDLRSEYGRHRRLVNGTAVA